MKQGIKLIIGLVFLNAILSHSTYYPGLPRGRTCNDRNNVPTIYSWHVHVVFNHNDDDQVQEALKLREQASKDLGLWPINTHMCRDLFHHNERCVFWIENEDGSDRPGPFGPFIVGQVGWYFMNEDYAEFVEYFLKHRGKYNFDVVFHPNTGCDITDHSWWTMWVGEEWPMNLTIWTYTESPAPNSREFVDEQGRLWRKGQRRHLSELLNDDSISPHMKQFLREHGEKH